jgi:hypothetical protein
MVSLRMYAWFDVAVKADVGETDETKEDAATGVAAETTPAFMDVAISTINESPFRMDNVPSGVSSEPDTSFTGGTAVFNLILYI